MDATTLQIVLEALYSSSDDERMIMNYPSSSDHEFVFTDVKMKERNDKEAHALWEFAKKKHNAGSTEDDRCRDHLHALNDTNQRSFDDDVFLLKLTSGICFVYVFVYFTASTKRYTCEARTQNDANFQWNTCV